MDPIRAVRVIRGPGEASRFRGVTLVELMIGMLASSILILAVTGVLAHNHVQWNQTYERVYGDIVSDAYLTRIVFDRVVRASSAGSCDPLFPPWGAEITLYLYTNVSGSTNPPLNRYARFVWDGTSGGNLVLEQGPLLTGNVLDTPDSTVVLAHNVTDCTFWRSGPCIHMRVVLDDGSTDIAVAVTATRQNP